MAKREHPGRPTRVGASSTSGRDRAGGYANGGQGRSPRDAGRVSVDPSLLFGRHAVLAALANPRRRVREILCSQEAAETVAAAIAGQSEERRAALPAPRVVDPADINALLGEGAVHQGVVVRGDPLPDTALEEVLDAAGPQAILMVLDQVTDPHNLGAVLRSAAAFGADALIVQDRHTPQVTAVVAKAASGALDVTPLVRVTNLARALRTAQESGFWCVGLAEEGSDPLHSLDLSGRTAMVMGAEGDGLRRLTRETCDQLVHLPTHAPIRSLNVSAAAAIALHHAAIAPSRKVG